VPKADIHAVSTNLSVRRDPIKPAIKEAPVTPRRLGLADLRAAAAARKQEAVA